MSNPSYELPPANPVPLDGQPDGGPNRIVSLTVHVELPASSPPEHDAAVVLRALHHATKDDIREYVGSSEASAPLSVPERPVTNPNWMRAPITDALTAHQTRIVSLIANLTNPEVAERLGISSNAVKSGVREIYKRLNVGDRVSAAAKALGFLGTRKEADDYWAGGFASEAIVPAEISNPSKPSLQARQKEILRRVLNGDTVNVLTRDFDTSLDSMRNSISAIARRLGLEENIGLRELQKYLQENVTMFDFLEPEQP